MKLKHFALATAALVGTAGTAFADCPTSGRISIVGNEFPAIQTVGAGAVACGGGAVEAKSNLTADHQKINVAGMSGNPAEYTTAIIAKILLKESKNPTAKKLSSVSGRHAGGPETMKESTAEKQECTHGH